MMLTKHFKYCIYFNLLKVKLLAKVKDLASVPTKHGAARFSK